MHCNDCNNKTDHLFPTVVMPHLYLYLYICNIFITCLFTAEYKIRHKRSTSIYIFAAEYEIMSTFNKSKVYASFLPVELVTDKL